MSIIHIKDRGGANLTFRQVGDMRFSPLCAETVLPELRNLKLRDDDLLIAGWMRCGTHWVWEMVNMLLKNNTETTKAMKEDFFLDYRPISWLDAYPSPRILNTHLRFRYLPDDIKTKRFRVIYLIRDPRDAVASWYHIQRKHEAYEYSGKWHDWLPVHLDGELDWGTWFDHVREWEEAIETHKNLDVHLWCYEDMKKNPVAELRKISEFLGTKRDEHLLEAIVEKCHIDKMRVDREPYDWQDGGENVHYMKGKIGTWKEQFTVEQYEMFEKVYRQKMAGSKFYEKYKGPVELL